MKKLSILALIAVAGFLASCSTVESGKRANLANSSWVMVEWNGLKTNEMKEAVQKLTTKVTLDFHSEDVTGMKGKVRAFAGCNNAMGQYEQTSRSSLTFGNLASTKKACARHVMHVENEFFKELSSGTFKRTIHNTKKGEELFLQSKDGQVLIFLKNAMKDKAMMR